MRHLIKVATPTVHEEIHLMATKVANFRRSGGSGLRDEDSPAPQKTSPIGRPHRPGMQGDMDSPSGPEAAATF